MSGQLPETFETCYSVMMGTYNVLDCSEKIYEVVSSWGKVEES